MKTYKMDTMRDLRDFLYDATYRHQAHAYMAYLHVKIRTIKR